MNIIEAVENFNNFRKPIAGRMRLSHYLIASMEVSVHVTL